MKKKYYQADIRGIGKTPYFGWNELMGWLGCEIQNQMQEGQMHFDINIDALEMTEEEYKALPEWTGY